MNRYLRLVPVVAVGLAATTIGVLPQLQARAFGEEYVVKVAPVDPIDPFRGAYVRLSYPDLVSAREEKGLDGKGAVYVPLVRTGDRWEGRPPVDVRPAEGPYLACVDRYEVRCGIESFFVSQGRAHDIEQRLAGGDAVAVLTIDGRGHAAVVDVR